MAHSFTFKKMFDTARALMNANAAPAHCTEPAGVRNMWFLKSCF
jgi:hypothetical protein